MKSLLDHPWIISHNLTIYCFDHNWVICYIWKVFLIFSLHIFLKCKAIISSVVAATPTIKMSLHGLWGDQQTAQLLTRLETERLLESTWGRKEPTRERVLCPPHVCCMWLPPHTYNKTDVHRDNINCQFLISLFCPLVCHLSCLLFFVFLTEFWERHND